MCERWLVWRLGWFRAWPLAVDKLWFFFFFSLVLALWRLKEKNIPNKTIYKNIFPLYAEKHARAESIAPIASQHYFTHEYTCAATWNHMRIL